MLEADRRPGSTARAGDTDSALRVNDVHSRTNPTRVARIVCPRSLSAVRDVVLEARASGMSIAVAGGRHAMGGQQFGSGRLLVDTRRLDRVLDFDPVRGTVEAESGILWPALIDALLARQRRAARVWSIAQKQTGADRLSLGGALSANIHGRGLAMRPLVGDIEAFSLVDAQGRLRRCSRTRNARLFRLAIGGYGLFGIIYSVRLRLIPRLRVERVAEVRENGGLIDLLHERVRAGHVYGDFQFCCDESSPDFLRRGVLSCYRPVGDDRQREIRRSELSARDWQRLIRLAHVDKSAAFRLYAEHYRSTSGQVYWSDTHQLATYLDGYHDALDRSLGAPHRGSEMITEIYAPRTAFEPLMADLRGALRRERADTIYGTVRLIEKDGESFLAWAREPWVCVVLNLHVDHTPDGLGRARNAFRAATDVALSHGGSYYLTYHRFATRAQVSRAHPRFRAFLQLKRLHDPQGLFRSDWFDHHARMFGFAEATGPCVRETGFARRVVSC